MIKKVDVWYSIVDGGDGSAFPRWFLSEQAANQDQIDWVESGGDGWGENCTGKVETFEGSNVHREAVEGARDGQAQ